MSERISLLDHGYLELVESWGSDERIIEAARMSTGKGFLGWGPFYRCRYCGCLWRKIPATLHVGETWSLAEGQTPKQCCDNAASMDVEEVPGDEKLLRYLWEHKHHTPFEMAGATFEVQAPIMVFREWHRHRTQSYNEMSARYTPLPDVNYIPSVERLLVNSKTNKQAGVISGANELNADTAEQFRHVLREMYRAQEELYQSALRNGVPKELARVHLPVGRYSRMRATANLRNWLGFLKLRMAPDAQWEIRQYANVLCSILRHKFPRTMELFLNEKR